MKRKCLTTILGMLFCTISTFADGINWKCDPYAYQYDMTAYIDLQIDDVEVSDLSRYTIAAFYGDECRGVAEIKTIEDHSYGYLRIRSNEAEGESITFQVFDTQTEKIAKCDNTIDFKAQDAIGKPSSPLVIKAKNQYKVTFIADDNIIESLFYYGDIIGQPDAPIKEGYTFDGWQNVPETMPAYDIEITGSYTVNVYAIKYYVDGEEYHTDSIAYGETITPIAEPLKEGYIFSGWSNIPQTMPAEDVTITGTFVFDYNADAYKRLNGQIAELQSSLDAAMETINAECKDIAGQFAEQIASIQNSIDTLSADVKTKYDAGELTADSNIETASIIAAIEKLLADAETAQQAYEAEQAKLAANEAAYTKLMQEIAELQAKLDAAKETISTECADVAAQFAEQLASLQNTINALQSEIDAKYANCELTAESTIYVADIVEAIETTTEAATEAQKEYEEAVGIHGINGNGAKVKAIYSLNGKRVSTTKPNQMYIIEYSDGRKVKAIVKK